MTATHVPGVNEIETFSGDYINTREPDPRNVHLIDIAHALGNCCRYSGHCERFYSVAEHAVLASKYAELKGWDDYIQLMVLHHDDAEAYLGDISRPLKPLLGDTYRELTRKMDEAIVEALDLPMSADFFHSPEVREADNFGLMVEAAVLLPSRGEGWSSQACNWDLEMELDDADDISALRKTWPFGLRPHAAKSAYLSRHHELRGTVK